MQIQSKFNTVKFLFANWCKMYKEAQWTDSSEESTDKNWEQVSAVKGKCPFGNYQIKSMENHKLYPEFNRKTMMNENW